MQFDPRAEELYRDHQQRIYRSTDRMFAVLLVLEYLASVLVAVFYSPFTWLGSHSSLHLHVVAAVLLGGVLTGLPLYLVRRHSGEPLTRYVIAVAQVGFSALLIHLSGGRIETHFHVFGSLAFLAIYRDWTVLVPATLVVAADHLLRGLFAPQSVFGVDEAHSWRWFEHACWVAFEDFFLIRSCLESSREMRRLARQQSQLEASRQQLEDRVAERTASLVEMHEQMCDLSRRAGMAEVASGVLHNVGNALNSVRVSASVINTRIRGYRTDGLSKALGMMDEHQADLPDFLSTDKRGKQLPTYLTKAVGELVQTQAGLLDELGRLGAGLDHIQDIVKSQQSHAGVKGVVQCVPVARLCEEALNLCGPRLKGVQVVQDIAGGGLVNVEKHRILQVLVNLLGNAAQAMEDRPLGQRHLQMRSWTMGGTARISVTDNGVGISPENAQRIFEHGFTTRAEGHGFGLHNSALQAIQSGGRLTFTSEGEGRGATFVLELPNAETVAQAA